MLAALPLVRNKRLRRSRHVAQAFACVAGRAAIAETAPGFEAVSWIGMVAPAGLPGPVMDKLWGAVHAAMRDKAVDDNLVSGGSEIVASRPEEFGKVMERDYAKYGKLSDLFKTAK